MAVRECNSSTRAVSIKVCTQLGWQLMDSAQWTSKGGQLAHIITCSLLLLLSGRLKLFLTIEDKLKNGQGLVASGIQLEKLTKKDVSQVDTERYHV